MAKRIISFPCYIGDKVDLQGQVLEINEIYLDKNNCTGADVITYLCHFNCDSMNCSDCKVGKSVLIGEEWDCDSMGTFGFTQDEIGTKVKLVDAEPETNKHNCISNSLLDAYDTFLEEGQKDYFKEECITTILAFIKGKGYDYQLRDILKEYLRDKEGMLVGFEMKECIDALDKEIYYLLYTN